MSETGKNQTLGFRFATEEDLPVILHFIRELAEYENLLHRVTATEDLLRYWIFEKKIAEVFFAVLDGREIGFALYFYNFSTFLGKAGIYIEDLFVLPQYRGRGYGRAIIARLVEITLERGCGRLDWQCLDWNAPSIGFYLSLGAEPQSEWTTYRLTGDALEAVAGRQ